MCSRFFPTFVLLAALASAPTSGGADDGLFKGAATLERDALVAAVWERHPDLEAARSAVAALEALEPLAGLREDPMVSYQMAPASLLGDIRFGFELEVSRVWAPRERLDRMRQAAGRETEQQRSVLAALRLDLAHEALRLHSELYLIDRELSLLQQDLAELEELKQASTARYAAGLGRLNEPLTAEVEMGHLHHRVIELESHREITRAGINVLLARDLDASLPPPADPPWSLAQHSSLLDAPARALTNRPELAAARAEIERYEHELALAKLWHRPEVEVSAGYSSMWDDREHRVMVGLAVSPPLSKVRREGRIREAEARLAQARAQLVALENTIRLQVFSATARWREAVHHLELYDSRLMPAARDEARATLAAYRAGDGELATVIESERRRRQVELGRFEALAELAASRAELDRMVAGGSL